MTAVFASQTVTETQPLASDEGKKLAAEDKTDDGKELAEEVKELKQRLEILQQLVTVLCHKMLEN